MTKSRSWLVLGDVSEDPPPLLRTTYHKVILLESRYRCITSTTYLPHGRDESTSCLFLPTFNDGASLGSVDHRRKCRQTKQRNDVRLVKEKTTSR